MKNFQTAIKFVKSVIGQPVLEFMHNSIKNVMYLNSYEDSKNMK